MQYATQSLRRRVAMVAVSLALAMGSGAIVGEVAAGAATASSLSATFSLSSTWSGGYVANFKITNATTTTVNGWKLVFTLPPGSNYTNGWNGQVTQAGETVAVTNASWNGSLAPGASATYGFQVAYQGAYVPPGDCTINGVAACAIPGSSNSGSSNSGSSSSSSGPSAGSGLTAALAVASSWSSGYTAKFTITNGGTTTATTWTVGFAIPSGGTMSTLWNGTDSVVADQVTVTPAGWNATLTPGASASFGFEVDNTLATPTGCTLDGSSAHCSVPGSTSTAGSGSAGSTSSACTSLPGSPGAVPFAPYADVTLWPQISLTKTACADGTRQFTVAFFQGPAAGGGCTPNLAGASFENTTLHSDIQSLRKLGGDAVGSFGGQAGQDLAQTCGTAAQLEEAYQSVVDYYGFHQIDFDVEGAAVAQPASIALRSAALAELQHKESAAGHPVKVSLTLPVLPTGLPQDELNVVRSAIGAGVQLNVVNVMAMDYGDGAAPNPAGNMGTYAIDAGSATEAQLARLFPQDTSAQVWAMVGVTPMIGQNDVSDEVFTLHDAGQLASWAEAHGIGRLAMWSANRDAPCAPAAGQLSPTCSGVAQAPWAYSKTFLPA